MAVVRVDTILCDVYGQVKFENQGGSFIFLEKAHDKDRWRLTVFLENEIIGSNIPVRDGLAQGPLKDHFTLYSPNLQKIR